MTRPMMAFGLPPRDLGRDLAQAVTRYDLAQARSRSYNRDALGLYLARCDEVVNRVSAGADLSAALADCFHDRLHDRVAIFLRERGYRVSAPVGTLSPLRLEDVARRYPRLLRACRWVAILSENEAVNCIWSYVQGLEWAGEAVNHYGGTRKVIESAVRMRHAARRANMR